MKTVGFPISHKENENRRALLPCDVAKVSQKQALVFEKGYGEVIGFNDEDYRIEGALSGAAFRGNLSAHTPFYRSVD